MPRASSKVNGPIKDKRPEKVIQRELAKVLDLRGYLWVHVPNEGARSSALEGRLLKLAGVKSGFPDIAIFDRPPNFPEAPGAAMELKSYDGTLTESQERWLSELAKRGWLTACAKGMAEALDILQRWGYL